MDDIQVAMLPAAVDACALYRLYMPHLNIKNSRFLFRLGPLDMNEMAGCSVAVVQRQVSEHNLNAIKRIQAKGIKVIYDLDDDIWNLPPWNPAKQTFDSMIEGFNKCAAASDLVTVSTQGLYHAAIKSFNFKTPILIVPNAIDFNLFYPKNLDRDETVVIGWGGSNTHSEDVKDAFEIIPELLDENPTARMEIVGAPAVETRYRIETVYDKGQKIKQKVGEMVSSPIAMHRHSYFRRWVPVGEYANRLGGWGWDIAMAPLANHRFNKSKSCIKMLEAAALKIPCLASNVQPYAEFCALGGKDLQWLLCDLPIQWKNRLRILVNEPERRTYYGELMYKTAYKYFNMANISNNWVHAFQEALKVQ